MTRPMFPVQLQLEALVKANTYDLRDNLTCKRRAEVIMSFMKVPITWRVQRRLFLVNIAGRGS